MFKRFFRSGVLALATAVFAFGFSAATNGLQAQDAPAMLSFGGGWYDGFAQDDQAADFRAEYRHNEGFWRLKPWVGVEATADGAVYGAGGLYLDVPLSERFLLTASLGAGGYHDGDGKDLGHSIIFRSQVEVGYRLANDHRVSLALSHLSNADLGDRNPGTEVVTLYYHLPLARIFGR